MVKEPRRTERETAKIFFWLRKNPDWILIHRRTRQTWNVSQMDRIPRSLFHAAQRRENGNILVIPPWKKQKRRINKSYLN